MSAARHTVHVRVNDAATGQPTPVRVRFTGPDGEYLAPLGGLTEFATGENEDVGGNLQLDAKKYAYTDGSFEIALPAGVITVEISKGPEYCPLHERIELAAGKMALRFSIGRWVDMRAQGWYSGDPRLHFISPHAALLEAAAEDVAVANLLAAETSLRFLGLPAIPNLVAFSGQEPALAASGHMVVVNTLNRHAVLGELALLNCHRIVYPLGFGDWRGDHWTLAAWCDQCHRKGGLVIWADVAEHPDGHYGEALAEVILGKVDAIEATVPTSSLVPDIWYPLLDCAFHVPLVGASAKTSNRQALGSVRTYSRLLPGQELSYKSWIEAVRAGRTVVTTGPMIKMTVNEQEPGSVIRLPDESTRIQVRAEARSCTPFHQLELVVNGEKRDVALASQATDSLPTTAVIETDLEFRSGGWLAARCVGGESNVVAHTSPIYVESEVQSPKPDATRLANEARLQGCLDKALEWVMHHAQCESDRQREKLASIFHSAKNILQHRAAGL